MGHWMHEWMNEFEGEGLTGSLLSLKLPCLHPSTAASTQRYMAPSLHIPKYLRFIDIVTQDLLVAFPSALFSFHFVDETWYLTCGLFLLLGFVNQSWFFGLLPRGSKNTESHLSLGSLLLGTLGRIQALGRQIFPRVLPSLWRKPFKLQVLRSLSVGWEVLLHLELCWEARSSSTSVQGRDDLMHGYSQATGMWGMVCTCKLPGAHSVEKFQCLPAHPFIVDPCEFAFISLAYLKETDPWKNFHWNKLLLGSGNEASHPSSPACSELPPWTERFC